MLLLISQLYFLPVIISISHIIYYCEVSKDEQQEFTGLSVREKIACAQLRAMIPDLMLVYADEFYQTDHYLLRWIRARDFNISAAHEMIRAAYEWRSKNQIDFILNETFPGIPSDVYSFDGQDKEGRPVGIIYPRVMDPRKLVVAGKGEKLLRWFDQMLEIGFSRVKSSKLTNGEPVSNVGIIVDTEGVNLRQHMCLNCLSWYFAMAQHMQNYYPEAVEYFVILNMNRFAKTVPGLIRPALSAQVQSKIKRFGTNKTEWSAYLLSKISPAQLPINLGGTRSSKC